MDASIIDGRDMSAGAVAGISRIKNPISLARIVKDATDHCLMIGIYAEDLAKKHGIKFVDEKSLRTDEALERLTKSLRDLKKPAFSDTVS